MRIVIDLQSLQTTGSRDRGIGRYSLALARAMIGTGGNHEWFLALNHAFPETIDGIRQSFADLLPREQILVYQVPAPVAAADPANSWRRRTAELVREHFLQQLRPDWVHVTSLFEGLGDDAVTSIGALTGLPTAVTLYDLIPYLNRQVYLTNPVVESWYMGKAVYLGQARLLLAISEHSRREVIDALGIAGDQVVNVSTDADASFQVIEPGRQVTDRLRAQYGVSRAFVMYTGGIDHRKNIERLIEAYARLPLQVRSGHQLVIVCKVQEEDRRRLRKLASGFGLAGDELVLTGYVSDEDLVAFYNLCQVFAFPSLHEGFGLPVLEAMRCGAAVIGSDRTSIPEVIGRNDALFNPVSVGSMADKLLQVLTDEDFRRALRDHALVQAGKFSWRESARRALDALESSGEKRRLSAGPNVSVPKGKPRLAYVSPLPPEESGIAAYSAELLPELARYYDIDLITDLQAPDDPWLAANLRLRRVAEFDGGAYDRILYQLGNSAFHSHMFALLAKHPGTVVLHDFFLSGILHHMEASAAGTAVFRQAVYRSHGYPALRHWILKGPEDTAWTYPASLEVLRAAQGVIVHSEYSLRLAERFFALAGPDRLVKIPHLRRPRGPIDRAAARRELGLAPDAFVVCSFGVLGPIKLNNQLLNAWLQSDLRARTNSYLVFVGGGGKGSDYERSLRRQVDKSGMGGRVKITGYAGNQTFANYLAAADVAVQLRARSRGETSGTVMDCLAYGVPTVVNDHGSMAELPPEVVVKLPDEFTISDLARAMERLQREPALREALGSTAVRYVGEELDPERIGRLYWQAIESFADGHPVALRRRLLSAVRSLGEGPGPQDQDLLRTAEAVAENAVPDGPPRLLVDISELVKRDAQSGIQRVVRSVLHEFTVPGGVSRRVEPVYRSDGLYRYARRFMEDLIGIGRLGLDDAPVDVSAQDLFLGLDLDPEIDEGARGWLRHQARRGLRTYFAVYDLLPVLRPDCFAAAVAERFRDWLEMVAGQADGLVCISRSVAEELGHWLEEHPVERPGPLAIGYFHLGAGIVQPEAEFSTRERAVLSRLADEPGLLMVGTVEPRKGHVQTLDAFEKLWSEGENVSLLIIGKQGWMMEDFVERLRRHPEAGRHLFWFEQIGDALLIELYRQASALLMASEGEGFGLPLVEAAREGLALIARDLPVFREVAGENAFYFSGTDAGGLAAALKEWLTLYREGKHPRSGSMRCLSWQESARQLAKVLFDGCWLGTWDAGQGFRWHSR